MKEKRMFHAMGSVNDKFIDEMYAPNEAKKKAIGHHPAKKMWLIAAVITAMVFMMGCAIVYALKMENLQIAESNRDKRILGDDGVTIIGTETVDQQVLTPAGLKGTAGYSSSPLTTLTVI